jgi:hypothetical protein
MWHAAVASACSSLLSSNPDSNFFSFSSLMQTKSGLVKLLYTKSTMEELFLRFPHLSENIFEALDNKSFADSKEVSKVWYNYLDDRKRKVKMIKKMIKKCQQVFHHRHFREYKPFSSAFNTIAEQTILNEARKGDFHMVHEMITAEFQKAYHPVSLDEFDDILSAFGSFFGRNFISKILFRY